MGNLQRRQRHMEELRWLGYTKDSLRPLKRIETTAHRSAEMYANGELQEDEYHRVEAQLTNQVATLFGGTTPKGFFINGDPRGYALKIDDDAYKTSVGRKPLPITYRDFGGYMVLAPDEFCKRPTVSDVIDLLENTQEFIEEQGASTEYNKGYLDALDYAIKHIKTK